MSICFLQ